jgi:hypothetical protein
MGEFPFALVSNAVFANSCKGEKYLISSPEILLEYPSAVGISCAQSVEGRMKMRNRM